jgi:hypothetical protein
MFVKVIKKFADKECYLKTRNAGDVFEVRDQRGQELIRLGYAEKTGAPKIKKT